MKHCIRTRKSIFRWLAKSLVWDGAAWPPRGPLGRSQSLSAVYLEGHLRRSPHSDRTCPQFLGRPMRRRIPPLSPWRRFPGLSSGSRNTETSVTVYPARHAAKRAERTELN